MSDPHFLPNESGDEMRGPIKRRIEELSDLVDEIFRRAQPVLDFVKAVQQNGFVVEIFGKQVLRLRVGDAESTRIK